MAPLVSKGFIDPLSVARQFETQGLAVEVIEIPFGKVNLTYRVRVESQGSQHYFILQRIAKNVFPRPDYMMHNLRVLTDYLQPRIDRENRSGGRIYQLPRIIQTRDKQDFIIDEEGYAWRALSQIENARPFVETQDDQHVYEVGYVLGYFHRLVQDIPIDQLHITLPYYHVTPRYLKQFDEVANTPLGRGRRNHSRKAQEAYRFVQTHRSCVDVLEDAQSCGRLKIRPVHGDPKSSNILIDEHTGNATALIDFDSFQPGLIHYDIGDAVRSLCNLAGEEPSDSKKVCFDRGLMRTFFQAYQDSGMMARLTDAERSHLFDCIQLIPFELGLRFYADYLAGDVYFKTDYLLQNLDCACVQFTLVEHILTQEKEIRKSLKSLGC